MSKPTYSRFFKIALAHCVKLFGIDCPISKKGDVENHCDVFHTAHHGLMGAQLELKDDRTL